MIRLFVGDSDNAMKVFALKLDAAAEFLHTDVVDDYLSCKTGTFYTGLCFLNDLKVFLKVCQRADQVFYYPPEKWTDEHNGISDQKKYVESVLAYVSQTKEVNGLVLSDNPYNFLLQDFKFDQRRTDKSQIWITGCSITQGDGVEQHESWKHIVGEHFQLPYSDLSLRGSSITWQSDQICQADIRSGDRVFWGLTTHVRMPVIDETDNSLFHLHAGSYQKSYLTEKVKPFPIDLLFNKTIVYHNVMAIRRAVNFCQKVGANITIIALMYDCDLLYKFYNVRPFRQATSWPDKWLDLGTDNVHPGPKQHRLFAEQFIEFYKELYN